jgi:hypothetical protein
MVDDKISIVERAERAAAAITEGNKKFAELVEKQEELAARIKLGGSADAGVPSPEKKEETAKEYKDRIMSGFKNGQK